MAAISEYYILKNIFSYLLPEDLNNVSLVCKEWCLVARKVAGNLCCTPFVGHVWARGQDLTFNRQMRPKVILHFKLATYSRKRKREKEQDLLDIAVKNYPVHFRSSTIDVVEFGFIFATQFNDGNPTQLKIAGKNNMMEALLLINDKPGFQVDIATDLDFREWESSKSQTFHRDFDQVKGIVYLSRSNEPKFINNVIKKFITNFHIPLVGGDTVHLANKDRTSVNSMIITFRGEKLDVQNAISQHVNDIDDVLKELAERSGPIPEKATRFAFIFSCIDRVTPNGDFETDAFHRYFAGVPCFGFYCLGEYFRPTRDDPKAKRTKKLRYFQSSTFLILTVKK